MRIPNFFAVPTRLPLSTATALLLLLLQLIHTNAEECEVCVDVLTEVMRSAEKSSSESGESSVSQEIIKKSLEDYCVSVMGEDPKREKLCYFIGSHPQAATSIVNSVTLPLSYSKPINRVCIELGRKDSQICDLKLDKPIDWDSLDFEKMRVKQLKELLQKLKDNCKGCVEKADYVSRIKELMPKTKPREEL